MSLDDALDALDSAGVAEIERPGGSASVDATEIGPLGVRVRRVRVDRDDNWDISDKAHALPQRLRALPERITPSEVAPDLGGAILRTHPDDFRGDGYFEVEVGERSAEVRRVKIADGERAPTDWTITREQLGRLIDELES